MRNWGQSGALVLALMAYATFAFGASQTHTQIIAVLGAGDAARAEQLADAALGAAGLAPAEKGRLLLDRGMAREALGHHDDALVDLTQAIEMHALPADEQARALFTRGAVLDGLGRSDDAIGDYSAALTVAPHFAPALNNRANAYRRQNRIAEAKRDYLASLAAGNLQPEYSYYGLGQLAEAAGNMQGARAFYAQAAAANPNYGLSADRLSALGGAPDSASADSGVIHLRPPKSVQVADTAMLVLRPPGSAAPARPAQATPIAATVAEQTEPGLRPALDAAGKGPQVQLGAWRSEAEAGQGWSVALRRSGGLLEGLSHHIVAVDLPGRGRYYRLRAGPAGPGLCSALQAQGVDCIAARD
jgi:tetratricopeptide (TPR) repeat protein